MALLTLALAACKGGGGSSKGAVAEPRPSETAVLPSGCTPVRFPPLLAASHIAEGTTATYNTVPPTSGKHFGRWATVGVYDEPLPNERQVHNLEHGHIMVQYHGLEGDQISELEQVVKSDPRMVLLAPYMGMDSKVSLTAWGTIQTCDSWSPGIIDLVKDFIRVNRDHAPESIP